MDWATPECHSLALVFRDALRRIWRNEQDALSSGLVNFVLGIDRALGDVMNKVMMPHIPKLNEVWSHLVARYPWPQIKLPGLIMHWGSGSFIFDPVTDFQRAVYNLFRESWRAKVCPCCLGFFIAQRAPQIYCSTRCYGMTKKRRGLDWWRLHGDDWRNARKASKKKHQRKRRKHA